MYRYELRGVGTLRATESYFRFGAAFVLGAVLVCLLPAGLFGASEGFDVKIVFPVGLGTLMLLVGLALGTWRRELLVAPSGIRLRTRGLTGWSEQVSGARVGRVRVTAEAHGNDGSSTTVYPVDLVLENHGELPGTFRLSQPSTESSARVEAEAISRGLDVPFADALGDTPIERPAGALDRAEPRPAEPREVPPSGVEVVFGTVGEEVRTRGLLPRARMGILIGVAVLSATSTAVAVVMVAGMLDGTMRAVAIVAAMAGEAIFVLVLVLLGSARERIWVASGRLQHEISVFGILISRRALDAPSVEYLRLQASRAGGVGVVTDAETRSVGRSLDADGAAWLRGWIGARI